MSNGGHSLFGPSGQHRTVFGCPRSAIFCESNELVSVSGAAAATGTLFHHGMFTLCTTGKIPQEITDIDMLDHIHRSHEIVLDLTVGAEVEYEVSGEVPITLSQPEYIPSGTIDVSAYLPLLNRLTIIDHKYGRIPVEARENPQLLSYAAIAVARLEARGETVDEIEMIINQPRHPNGWALPRWTIKR